MDLREWREVLAAIKAPDGWLGHVDDAVQEAEQLLDRLEAGEWVAHHIPEDLDANRDERQPQAAKMALRERHDLLQVALTSELWRLARLEPGAGFDEVVRTAVAGALAPGIRHGVRPWPKVDDETRLAMQGWFDDAAKFRSTLKRLDRCFGTHLHDLLGPDPVDLNASQAAYRLGQVWTASAALVVLDWATQRKCATPRDLALLLWSGDGPYRADMSSLQVRGGPLPSKPKPQRLHALFCLFPALAQVFEGQESNASLPPSAAVRVHVPLHANNYVSEYGEVSYNGRNTRQLYLTALVLCLHAGNRLHPGD